VIFATTRFFYSPRGASGFPTPPDTAKTRTRVYKSTDGGVTWAEVKGLPRITGRTSISVAGRTNGQRVFLITRVGRFRTDDGGGTWRRMAADDKRIANGQ